MWCAKAFSRARLTGRRAPAACLRYFLPALSLTLFLPPAVGADTLSMNKRSQTAAPASPARTRAIQSAGRRVVTNKELEAFRQRRLTQEESYERERARQGLPSREEMRQQTQEQDRRFIELARQIEAARAAEEAERLRREVALLQAQVGLLSIQQSQQQSEFAGPALYPFVFFPGQVQLSPGLRHRFGHRFGHTVLPRRVFGTFHQPIRTRPGRGHFYPGGRQGRGGSAPGPSRGFRGPARGGRGGR